MKLKTGLTRYMNACMSQLIQQGLPIRMQPEQDMPMPREDDNASKYFGPHKNEEYTLDEQNIEGDHRDLVDKSSNIRSRVRDNLSKRTPQDGVFASELLLSLREVRFSEQEFPVSKPISDIKYHHLSSQKNNPFHPFNDQLDYVLINYFADFETIKGNVDRFLSDLLMFPLTEKLSY